MTKETIENKIKKLDVEYYKIKSMLEEGKMTWSDWNKKRNNLYNEYIELKTKLKQLDKQN